MLKGLLDYRQEGPYCLLIDFYGRRGRLADAYAAGKSLRVMDLLRYPRERDYPEAMRTLLRAFRGDFDRLAAAARADVEAHPNEDNAAWFAAEVEHTVGSQRTALDRYRQAAERDDSALAWFTCARVAEEIGCLKLAAEALGHAVELSPGSPGLRAHYQDALAALADRQPLDRSAS
jgi:tetratricopeptide (TPR) repeat protein